MSYKIKQFAVTDSAWTAIVAPNDCNNISLLESTRLVAFKIRTDSLDAATEDTLAAGSQELIFGAPLSGQEVASDGQLRRFRSGDTICYVQSSSGNIVVIARFI